MTGSFELNGSTWLKLLEYSDLNYINEEFTIDQIEMFGSQLFVRLISYIKPKIEEFDRSGEMKTRLFTMILNVEDTNRLLNQFSKLNFHEDIPKSVKTSLFQHYKLINLNLLNSSNNK